MSRITLVLLPGLDGTGRLFNPLLGVLPSSLQPLVIPYPGHKFLGHDELLQYVEAKIPTDQPFVLLAESFSGSVAVELAATHPPHLKALILCASFATNPLPASFAWLRLILNAQLFRLRPPQFLVRHFLLGRDAPSDLVNTFLDVLRSVSREVLSSRMRSVINVDVRGSLRECRVPILYLAAKHDKLVGERNLTEIKSLAPNIEAVTIDAPHLLLQREPAKAMKAINDFLHQILRDI